MAASYFPGGVGRVHDRYVHSRRVRVLADALLPLLPASGSVLDVGCGDGLLARAIVAKRPELTVTGLDVLVRPGCAIPVRPFDGRSIPTDSNTFDAVLCVDVLHHAEDPRGLLREMSRVGRRIVLKDHTRDGWLAGATLQFMDWVGNARHGVALPYTYWSTRQWNDVFHDLGLVADVWEPRVPLYPPPASWIFGRRLHVVSALRKRAMAPP